MIENKKYFIEEIDATTANKVTKQYHYSHQGFLGAKLNLGIFHKVSKELVGVLQWGRSAAHNIRLDRYVKEPLSVNEYYELNRFCMADSEEKNSESQAISLGIKWIKKNQPSVRLLVSYAGRKEGNYGYIYQATNWEYLGYFISPAFWSLDGKEYHQLTVWQKYKLHGDQSLSMIDGICNLYHDVRQTKSKQFIYIQRLDKKLTPMPQYPYPKPLTEYPIVTETIIHKQNDEYYKERVYYSPEELQHFYYGKFGPNLGEKNRFAVYKIDGTLEGIYGRISEIKLEGYKADGIRTSINENKKYKKKYFKKFERGEIIPLEIEVETICWIEEIPFYTMPDIVQYTGLSKQAVQQSRKKNGKILAGKGVIWNNELSQE